MVCEVTDIWPEEVLRDTFCCWMKSDSVQTDIPLEMTRHLMCVGGLSRNVKQFL